MDGTRNLNPSENLQNNHPSQSVRTANDSINRENFILNNNNNGNNNNNNSQTNKLSLYSLIQ